jgi:hypothetical protein
MSITKTSAGREKSLFLGRFPVVSPSFPCPFPVVLVTKTNVQGRFAVVSLSFWCTEIGLLISATTRDPADKLFFANVDFEDFRAITQ